MDEFNVELFVANPTLLVLDSLKKTNLLTVVQHYKLSVTTTYQNRKLKL